MLYRDSSEDDIGRIRAAELIADKCVEHLKLSALPAERAVWTILSATVFHIESSYSRFGPDSDPSKAAMINLGRYCPMIIRWLNLTLPEKLAKDQSWLWESALGSLAKEDILTASQYDAFQNAYPMWYHNRTNTEILEGEIIRFTVNGSNRDRQVSAYQKGLKPLTGRFQATPAQAVQPSDAILRRYSRILEEARVTGLYEFRYEHSFELARRTYTTYKKRLEGIMRRSDTVDLGPYSLGIFKRFYAAVQTLSAIHEYICFCWMKLGHPYPLGSAVLIKERDEWGKLLAHLSKLDPATSLQILSDLTFYSSRLPDLHVYPFVPLDSSHTNLALIPHFILNSSPEDNILRVCSYLRPQTYNRLSNDKEATMREDILASLTEWKASHSICLPDGSTEIDLVVEDVGSSTVLIAELKWYRKPVTYRERLRADEQFWDGVHRQLGKIKRFCRANPDFLRNRNALRHSLSKYEHVYFALIARDHWNWMEPADHTFVLDSEQFLIAIRRHRDLNAALCDLISYDWLPVEERDFHVRFDRACVEGAQIETEVFYGA